MTGVCSITSDKMFTIFHDCDTAVGNTSLQIFYQKQALLKISKTFSEIINLFETTFNHTELLIEHIWRGY